MSRPDGEIEHLREMADELTREAERLGLYRPVTAKNPHLSLPERASIQFPPGFTVYRVQDCWKVRRGVVIRGARRWWMRTWQSEWDGAPRAYRAFTRNGALIRGVRAAAESGREARHGEG